MSYRVSYGGVNCGNLYSSLLQLGRLFTVLCQQESARTAEDYEYIFFPNACVAEGVSNRIIRQALCFLPNPPI